MQLDRYDPFNGELGISLAVTAGNVVHVAGTVAIGPDGSPPPGLEAQMRQTYVQIGEILETVGSRFADVADQTVYFVGDGDDALAAALKVHKEVYGDTLPASTMVGVEKLLSPAHVVEIKVTAYKSSDT